MSIGKKLRSLRLFVFLLVGGSLAVFTIILFSIFQTNMPRMLLQSENRYLTKQLDVVAGLFNSAMRNTYLLAEDTAIWEETVHFAEGTNPDYIKNNWPDTSLLQSFRLNFVVIKDMDGNDLYVEFLDHVKNEKIPVPAGFTDYLNSISREILAKYENAETQATAGGVLGKKGILFFEDVPYTIAAMPIIASRESDRPVGTIILGNILNNSFFRELTHYNTSTFELIRFVDDEYSSEAAIRRVSDDIVATDLPLKDIDGNPVLLRMSDNRQIYAEGRRLLNWTTFMLVVSMALFAVVLYQIVIRLILRPIERLSSDIGKIASSGGLETEKYSKSREFVTLCSAINDMLRRLNQSKISTDVLQRILNGMDAYVYVSDPATGLILFNNDKMMQGYNIQGDAVGRPCWEVLRPGSTRRCKSCPSYALEKDPTAVIIWEEFHAATGRYHRNTDRLIEWSDGKMVQLHHAVDITDVKVAEETLKKRLEQQNLMSAMSQNFISAGDMSTLIDNALHMAGEFMDVSKILLARLEETGNTLIFEYEWHNEKQDLSPLKGMVFAFGEGRPIHDAFIKDKASYVAYDDITDMEQFSHLNIFGIKAFMAVPIHASGQFWGILSFSDCRGGRVWSESDIQLITLIGSVISGVITRNMTEENLIRMSSIVNSSPQYISYINGAGHFEYFNQGALNILGYTAEELQKDGIATILDEETHRRSIEEIIPRIMKEGKYEFELPITRKDGQRRILSFSAFRTELKTVGVGAIASDITERRRLEQDLIAAKELAEQSSRAKGEFLSRMSHEMRTPMNAIIGMTRIAKSAKDLEKKEYCLDKIDDASNHLLGVINDILDMSKIEANKFELSYTEFSFEKMLMRVINVVNFRVDEKDQNLIVNIDKNVPYSIVSDEQRLAQVITNLLSNAIKFTPEQGTITLSVRCRPDEEEGLNVLQIDISDTGIGISAEQQAKLFRSFEQADGGVARKFGGTGLGLVISKNIIEMMDGRIWIESEIGKGATFSFDIKAKTGKRTQKNRLSSNINWKNLRVLAVDDAPEVREYFLNIAQSIGFSCVIAADGFEAFRLIDENQDNAFNIIFVDWKMPGMSGIELTKRIKDSFGDNVVVIMISATEWSDIEQDAKAVGVDGFIAKPLFSSLIVDCINESLGANQHDSTDIAVEQVEESHFAGCRILLAEDIEINREIVMALLEHTGIEIDCAENGQEACTMFRENPSRYDMIFMDIHMPEVDGYEATVRIRALDIPEARSIPIIAMTANVFREDIERCLAAGMNDHVGKPVNVEDLFDKLRKNLLPKTN